MEKGKVIGHRTEERLIMERRENDLKQLCGALEAKAKEILGTEVKDLVSFYSGPYDYLINEFHQLYGQNEPAHIDKETFVNSKVKINKFEIDKMAKLVGQALRQMFAYRPTIAPDGINWKVKKSDFDMILDPEKEPEYNAVKKLYDAALELKEKFGESYNCAAIEMHRYHPGIRSGINSELEINTHRYAK